MLPKTESAFEALRNGSSEAEYYSVSVRHEFSPALRVEADNGYVGAADKVKCPDNPCNPVANEGMQSRVRSRHEMINARFKTWSILKNTYRHNIRRHGEVFRAIAIVTQLGIDNGEPLFQVDYED